MPKLERTVKLSWGTTPGGGPSARADRTKKHEEKMAEQKRKKDLVRKLGLIRQEQQRLGRDNV